MRIRSSRAALAALALGVMSCTEGGTLAPTARTTPRASTAAAGSALPSVRVSEIHYDNAGTDAGEAIEISGPAGMDVSGWQIVLYNGNASSLSTYNTRTLSGPIPATCGARGVVVVTYPSNGIQNGGSTATGTTDPDGFALVDANGAVVELLSYEGTFTAANGPAAGMTSTDLGVRELGSETGMSLQRDGSGAWSAPAASTFGACNDDQTPNPPAAVASIAVAPASASITVGATQQFTATALDASSNPIPGAAITWSSDAGAIATVSASGLATGIATGDAHIIATADNGVSASAALHVDPATTPGLPAVRVSEIHYDNSGTDTGEAIEVEGPAGTDLAGWSVVLYNGNGGVAYGTRALSGTISDMCGGRGVVALTYPQDGIQNGSPDGFALVDANGHVVELLSYEGTLTAADGPAAGMTSVDIGVQESTSSPIGQSLQRDAEGAWSGPKTASVGACNGAGGGTPAGNHISFSGRLPSDAPLPVGFQDQLFATVRDASNATVNTTVTWSSDTPAIATIDQNGVMTALAAGTATFRATTADGQTTATWSLPTIVATSGGTAQYAGNTEFGEPVDADASDDFIIRRPEYTISYSRVRNTPNWVGYDIDASHFGAEDRCDCFTFDPSLPASYAHYTTADYTGAGTYHGYGIDRGHLVRSFDRTTGSLDNAYTFLFSNIIPQASDLNQGPWAAMESALGDLARLENKEVYVIAGVAGSKGTLKDQGVITIPAKVWKVAVILPRDEGLASVHSYADVQVVAAIMPNDPGVRNVDWHTYETTVDAVEALSGYDLLSLLPDPIEIAVESNTKPPKAALDGPWMSLEGSLVSLSGAASSDPDGDALTYAWSFGDGASASGASVTHRFAQDGSYTVRLIATDIRGLADTTFATATVANVAPSIGAFAGATLLPGETYSATGSFADPGADPWSATADYGDGAGQAALALSGMGFSLSHTYSAAGAFTVTVRVRDDDVTSSRMQTVTVLTAAEGARAAIALVDALAAAGTLSSGEASSLDAKLDAAEKQLGRGNTPGALGPLGAVLNELDAMVRSGRVAAADVAGVRSLVGRVITSIGTVDLRG